MIVRLKIVVDQREYSALLKAGESDLRSINDQARYFIRQELERRGLLAPQPAEKSTVSMNVEV